MIKHSENIFCEYTVTSWEDCRNLFKVIEDWVFRGQSNSDWSLQTTLERGASINSSNIRDIPKIEKKILDKFQRRVFRKASRKRKYFRMVITNSALWRSY